MTRRAANRGGGSSRGHNVDANCLIIGRQVVLTPSFSEPILERADSAERRSVASKFLHSLSAAQRRQAVLDDSVLAGRLPMILPSRGGPTPRAPDATSLRWRTRAWRAFPRAAASAKVLLEGAGAVRRLATDGAKDAKATRALSILSGSRRYMWSQTPLSRLSDWSPSADPARCRCRPPSRCRPAARFAARIAARGTSRARWRGAAAAHDGTPRVRTS